jgi:hypothetical protein
VIGQQHQRGVQHPPPRRRARNAKPAHEEIRNRLRLVACHIGLRVPEKAEDASHPNEQILSAVADLTRVAIIILDRKQEHELGQQLAHVHIRMAAKDLRQGGDDCGYPLRRGPTRLACERASP